MIHSLKRYSSYGNQNVARCYIGVQRLPLGNLLLFNPTALLHRNHQDLPPLVVVLVADG